MQTHFRSRHPLGDSSNTVGMTGSKSNNVASRQITIRGMDCLNNTKLLDIKPAICLEILNYCMTVLSI